MADKDWGAGMKETGFQKPSESPYAHGAADSAISQRSTFGLISTGAGLCAWSLILLFAGYVAYIGLIAQSDDKWAPLPRLGPLLGLGLAASLACGFLSGIIAALRDRGQRFRFLGLVLNASLVGGFFLMLVVYLLRGSAER